MATGASGSINFGTTNINAAGGNTTAAQRASAWSINGFNNTFYSGFDNGTVAAGGVRVSAANNTTADRALGFLGTGSGTAANGNLVAQFSNATGSTVTSFLVDYTGEWWRQGGTRPSILTVQYSLGASAGAGGWNNISSFNYNVNSLINSSNTARNGDLSGNRTDFAAVNINSVSLNSGDSLWVKWFYNGNANGTGSGAKQTFALDDISVTFNGAAPPPASGNFWVGSDTTLGGSGTWVASGGTAWNTTDTDGTGQAFTANQTANFGGATAGTVTVSGTVAPEAGLNFTTTGYTVTGGTINLAGANATANTITTNTSVTATISSNMTGSNGMTKAGAGNLILSGTNSYGGGTVVNAGTLTGTTNSLQGAITNNATVVFNQGTAGTYAGSMTGTGSLTKNGAGDVTLSGTNSYSGGTTVTAGTLTGTTSSLQGGITNNATVVFNQDTTGTYAGNMTGTGSLVKDGAGDVTLGGTNSYSGGTTVTAGTLTGTTTSLQGAITNNAAVVFNQGTAGTYAGDMGGSGSLTKSGATKISPIATGGAGDSIAPGGEA
jgi:autotransporter-associated beta strand protein